MKVLPTHVHSKPSLMASKLSLFCTQPVADGWPLMWVNRWLDQPGQLSLSSLWGQ